MKTRNLLFATLLFLLATGFGPLGGGGSGAGSGTVTSVAGTTNQVNVASGTTSAVISLVGPYTPATYTAHGLLIGEGTSSIVAMAVCGTGTFIYGQSAADPICSTLVMPNSAVAGDLLAATSTNTISSVADVATGQVLASGGVGVVPAYTSAPTIAQTNFTGTLTAAKGGTGTAYGEPAASSLGSITNGGTATCDFTNTNKCVFTVASGASFTLANPTSIPPAGNCVDIVMKQAATGFPSITWGSLFFYYNAQDDKIESMTGKASVNTIYVNAATGAAHMHFCSDGTELTLMPGSEQLMELNKLTVKNALLLGAGINGTNGIGGAGTFAITSTGAFSTNSTSASAIASTSGGIISTTGGTAPTLTAGCNGAGSSVATGSTDNRGKITTQTSAATTCTLTFNHTWPQAPFCVASDAEATITPVAYSVGATGTGTVVFDFVSASNDVFNYFCM